MLRVSRLLTEVCDDLQRRRMRSVLGDQVDQGHATATVRSHRTTVRELSSEMCGIS